MHTEVKRLQLTLKKSVIGRTVRQRATVKGLGLRKINSTVMVNATPEVLGMIEKVHFLLLVEPIS